MNISFKGDTVYVRIKRNEIIVRNIGTKAEFNEVANFTTERLLVGQFTEAEATIKRLIDRVGGKSWLKMLTVVIHPMEMTEGGLSQIEDRVLRELAAGAGAKKVRIWIGPELTDEELLRELG